MRFWLLRNVARVQKLEVRGVAEVLVSAALALQAAPAQIETELAGRLLHRAVDFFLLRLIEHDVAALIERPQIDDRSLHVFGLRACADFGPAPLLRKVLLLGRVLAKRDDERKVRIFFLRKANDRLQVGMHRVQNSRGIANRIRIPLLELGKLILAMFAFGRDFAVDIGRFGDIAVIGLIRSVRVRGAKRLSARCRRVGVVLRLRYRGCAGSEPACRIRFLLKTQDNLVVLRAEVLLELRRSIRYRGSTSLRTRSGLRSDGA